ncbi:MAG: geranylgeranylglycerol-phosphate geranylgeranyltransferase [Vicingaceae bacterium]
MKLLLDFFKLVRLPNLIIIGLTQYAIRYGIIYPFLVQANLDLFLSESLFGMLVAATVLIAAAGYIINDYFDVKLDYLNKPEQLVVGKSIKRRYAMVMHIIFNIIGLALAAYVAYVIAHPMLVLFQLVSAALLWFYSVSFKKQVIIGNLIIASLTALVPFTAGYYEIAVMFDSMEQFAHNEAIIGKNLGSLLFSIKYLLYWIIGYSAFAFLLTMIREIVKDMEDIEGDKAFDCKTFPIVFGIPKTKKLAIGISLFTLACISLLEVMQWISNDWISLAYFVVFISLPLIYVSFLLTKAKTKKHFFIISQSIKVCMLFGILYTLVIYAYQ